ncbi:hypothetical protein [Enterovirga sp.]|jgi:hypothetical protein|uniref:hypothetical protein n=1 Tax=Enterovirga sp. TaxID=2026350 RepID=UPI00261BF041|nr:hypothetical protein [Enterovirga sp.]MDB5592006.1 hypothetical protein [Enterovirga sp.]
MTQPADAAAEATKSRKSTGVGATANPGDRKLPENSKENLDKQLDNAVEETFPGSDPVSVKITK